MGLNVLYLTYDGLTDPLGQSQVLPYVSGLADAGHSFTIISFEKEKNFADQEQQVKSICNEHNISWVPLPYHKKPPVVSTLFDIIRLRIVAKRICHEKNIQVVHCRSYLTSLIGLRAKRKWGAKFIFDMRGFWADERVEGGLWNLTNPIYKTIYSYFKKKEREFLVKADHTISLTYNAKKEIESWAIKSAPITVIPTCVDLKLFDPHQLNYREQKQLRSSLGIGEKDFVLLYLGSWGTWYLTNEMLAFFSKLKDLKPQSKFLIVTSDKVNLENYPFRKDIVITKSLRQSVPLHISIADLTVCFIKTSFSKKASSATKLAELMAMQIPIVTNSGWGDIDHITSENLDSVFTTDNIDLDKLKTETNSRPYCEKNFSLQYGVEQYLHVYRTIG